MENARLVVGLGNPGKEYAQTRHNAGFLVTTALGQRQRVTWATEKRFESRVARFSSSSGHTVFLAQPLTYMNNSGMAVGSLLSFYNIDVAGLLVIVDDADLPLGTLRLRPEGSSGGHHGLESIERCLGKRSYARLRMGIGRRGSARQITAHVLGRFESTETALLNKVLSTAADQVESWLAHGVQKAMNEFNGAVEDPANEGTAK